MYTSSRTVTVNKVTGSLASISLQYNTHTYEMTFVVASNESLDEAVLKGY